MKNKLKSLIDSRGTWIFTALYFFTILLVLIYYQGIPYFSDNNESFSSIIHAKNLIHYDFFKSFGLTDESYGIIQEAHPFIYTHQGNFPRIFSALLFFFGFKSIELQIIIHIIFINSLGFYFAYKFFEKITTKSFAIIYCLFLLSDFIMFFQWQFVTWRTWHIFFLFSSLLLVEKYLNSLSRSLKYIILLNFICLGYFEISFSIFVSLVCCIYSIFKYRNLNKRLLNINLLLFSGLLLGFGILIIQACFYLGYQGFMNDLYFTFKARNYSPSINIEKFNEFKELLWDFVQSNHLVFWENYVNSSIDINGLKGTIRTFYRYNLHVYSPLLILVLSILIMAIFFRIVNKAIKKSDIYITDNLFVQKELTQFFFRICIAFLIICLAIYSTTGNFLINIGINGDFTFGGLSKYSIIIWPVLFIYFMNWILPKKDIIEFRIDLLEIFLVIAYFILIFAFAKFQIRLFDVFINDPYGYYENLWKKIAFYNIFHNLIPSIIIISSSIVGLFILLDDKYYDLSILKNIKNLNNYLISGILAYLIIWWIMPGYVLTGYLGRYVPFLVFFNILIICIPCYLIFGILKNELRKISYDYHEKIKSKWIPRVITNLPLLIIYLYIIVSWIFIQVTYFYQFSNNTNTLLKELANNYRGASVVANTYAAPFAVQTGQWAYFDPNFSDGRILKTDRGFFYDTENKYNWLRDKFNNQDYKFPDYFVCFFPKSFNDLAFNNSRCDRTNFFKSFDLYNIKYQTFPKVVSQDQSGMGKWAIVKLDNDFPPYLSPNSENLKMVQIKTDGNLIKINYNFHQQFGKNESNSKFNLYKLKGCKNITNRELISSSEHPQFSLNLFDSSLYQISVVPGTITKTGSEYFSAPFTIQNREVSETCANNIKIESPHQFRADRSSDQLKFVLSWANSNQISYYEIQKSENNKHYLRQALIDQPPFSIEAAKLSKSNKEIFFRIRGCNDWACSNWAYTQTAF